jgi:hypothetical protein
MEVTLLSQHRRLLNCWQLASASWATLTLAFLPARSEPWRAISRAPLALGASNPHFVARNKTVCRAEHRVADVIST